MKIILLSLFLLQGCAIRSNYPIEMKLSHLDFVRINPVEQRFVLDINIKNTQSKPLFIRTLEYKLLINNIQIHSAEEFVWREIPPFSTEQVSILVSANLWGLLRPLANSIKDAQTINYDLKGELVTGSLFYQRTYDIRHAGILTPDQLPKKKIEKLKRIISRFNP